MNNFNTFKRIVDKWASTHTDVTVVSTPIPSIPDYDVPETLQIEIEDANDETKYISFHVSYTNTWHNVSPSRDMPNHPVYVHATDESDDMDENESERMNAIADSLIDAIKKDA